MASLQADARTFFSGDSSAGPGVYGSSGYMQSLEQQVGASRSTNRKQEAKLKKLEEELHNCRDRLSRSMVISDGNTMVSVGTTTERKLDRTQREVRSTELKRQKLQKGYESRMRVLESTVGDLMVQLELVQKDLSLAEKENAELKEDSESAAWDRRHTEKERQDMEAQQREVAELPVRIEEMKQERDGLQAELKKGAAATKARVSKIESEISGLRSKLKQAEGLKEREKELDRDVKELNEARRASLMHKSKEKALEDRLVPEEIDARALKKKVAQVVMTIRSREIGGKALVKALAEHAEMRVKFDQLDEFAEGFNAAVDKLPAKNKAKKKLELAGEQLSAILEYKGASFSGLETMGQAAAATRIQALVRGRLQRKA